MNAALQAIGKNSQDTLVIRYNERDFPFWNGKSVQEDSGGSNSFDDNLNGLIDENRGKYDKVTKVFQYLYVKSGVGNKCINYITKNGLNNLLIDERRDDGIDNNNNWNSLTDDVGEDGLGPDNPKYPGKDKGEGDGIPTAGEPHFDKTDIYESDMLGLTSFELYQWGSSAKQSDDELFWQMLIPGGYRSSIAVGNVELLYGSGYFPMPPNHTERFSMGLMCASTPSYSSAGTNGSNIDVTELVNEKKYVQDAYAANYNFSKAPDIPSLSAITGDKRVILLWDDKAEKSYDPYSSDTLDFEGYRIYRSTDPGWNDASPITNAQGTSTLFRKPIVQFDLDNQFSGYANILTEGVGFFLGTNTGLRHFWIDTTVTNGTTYYYAVTSYDHGDPTKNVDPSECAKFVGVSISGQIEKGSNVVVVRPEAPSAGFISPGFLQDSLGSKMRKGQNNTATGAVDLVIIDPTQIRENNIYQISFNAVLSTNNLDSTKSFTLVNLTSIPHDTLLMDSPLTRAFEGLPITHGFQLSFANNPAELVIDSARSGWNKPKIMNYSFNKFSFKTLPVKLIPGDFEIIFSDVGIDTSKLFYRGTELLDPIPVNFTINNKITKRKVDFAFYERHVTPGDTGIFSFDKRRRSSDMIILLSGTDSLIAGWQIQLVLDPSVPSDTNIPGPGDTLMLYLNKPFLSNDTFEFTTIAQTINQGLAKASLDKIRVVPNPYIVTNSWEPKNPYTTGRGERQLHFIHLPAKCTIRIFNIRGQLVNTLES